MRYVVRKSNCLSGCICKNLKGQFGGEKQCGVVCNNNRDPQLCIFDTAIGTGTDK